MLFHNVYTMSTNATPTRVSRDVILPGNIDTRVPYDHNNSLLSYSGLHTPPQSAHDSRRPSCAYTALSEGGSFSGASMTTCSHPPTPINDVHQSSPQFGHRWSVESAQSSASLMPPHTGRPSVCTTAAPSMDNAIYHPQHNHHVPVFPHPAIYNAGDVGNADYASAYHANGLNPFGPHLNQESSMQNEWNGSQELFKSTLIAMSNGIPPDAETCASLYQHGAPLQQSPEAAMLAGYQMTPNGVSAPVFQSQQVVMPMQINCMNTLTSPTHVDQHHPSLCSSFDSNTSGWDMMDATSPTGVCFSSSSDEEYMGVKHEEPVTPNASLSPRRISVPPSAGSTATNHTEPARARRVSRRTRKSHSQGRAWLEYKNNWDFLVRFEGKPFTRGPEGTYVTEETRDPKPHRCMHRDEHGNACERRFERSEHLKRHMGMHTKERKYPCPLPGCGKKIGRPDNAGDHFKTHLRLPKKGKRNKHFDMAFLEKKIIDAYPEKQAEKMLTNLKKWKVGEDERVRAEEERARMEEEVRRFER